MISTPSLTYDFIDGLQSLVELADRNVRQLYVTATQEIGIRPDVSGEGDTRRKGPVVSASTSGNWLLNSFALSLLPRAARVATVAALEQTMSG